MAVVGIAGLVAAFFLLVGWFTGWGWLAPRYGWGAPPEHLAPWSLEHHHLGNVHTTAVHHPEDTCLWLYRRTAGSWIPHASHFENRTPEWQLHSGGICMGVGRLGPQPLPDDIKPGRWALCGGRHCVHFTYRPLTADNPHPTPRPDRIPPGRYIVDSHSRHQIVVDVTSSGDWVRTRIDTTDPNPLSDATTVTTIQPRISRHPGRTTIYLDGTIYHVDPSSQQIRAVPPRSPADEAPLHPILNAAWLNHLWAGTLHLSDVIPPDVAVTAEPTGPSMADTEIVPRRLILRSEGDHDPVGLTQAITDYRPVPERDPRAVLDGLLSSGRSISPNGSSSLGT